MEEVKLLGFWASPYVDKVIWALKLKGVKYEYIEEDIFNKSQLLLQSNPVHRKVPVLFHGAKSISESDIILEYIEETWPANPLFPKDPYQRALARFWINFGAQKVPIFLSFYLSTEENQEKATSEVREVLKTLEEQALKDKVFFDGETIGLVDISYGWLTYWLQAAQEIVGVKVLEPTTFPRLCEWVQNFKRNSVIGDNLPDCDRLMVYLKQVKPWLLSRNN